MKAILILVLIILLVITSITGLWFSFAYRDIHELREVAPAFIEDRGFKITSYDGYQGSIIHGGFVWYQARDGSDYLYEMCIGEWRGTLMLYNLTCLNAVTN